MNLIKRKKGFTLIEMLFYIAVVSTLLLTVTEMVGTLTSARLKGEAISEVDSNGITAVRTITREVKDSLSIISPTPTNSATSLSIQTENVTTDPIIFTTNTGVLTMSEAGGTPIQLTSNRVVVTNIEFYNYSSGGTTNSISFEITLSHSNPDNRSELNYERTFYGTATTRE